MINQGVKSLHSFLVKRLKLHDVYYITEGDQWSISQDALNLCRSFSQVKSAIETSTRFIYKSIIHFGSINAFCWNHGDKFAKVHKSNKVVVTWFHVEPNDPRLMKIQDLDQKVDLWHTSCNITKKILVDSGIIESKIVVIPLGININVFSRYLATSSTSKKSLGIGDDCFVVGSFQKDGVGWGEGMEPKMVKGPDIFLNCLDLIKGDLKLFVLLTGPARGYIKSGLEKRGIPFYHVYPKKFEDVISFYGVIDLYLMTSRVEGGPKSVLESAVSRVPLVATNVGMLRDYWQKDTHAYLSESEDVDGLAKNCLKVASLSKTERDAITNNAYALAMNFDYDMIAQKYEKSIYTPLAR